MNLGMNDMSMMMPNFNPTTSQAVSQSTPTKGFSPAGQQTENGQIGQMNQMGQIS
jgi:hypothetical protein